MNFRMLLSSLGLFAGLAAAGNISSRQLTNLLLCTESRYPGSPCPYGIPYGSGICASLEVTPNRCYNFADFPEEQISGLPNNVTHIFFQPVAPYGNCDLFKTDDCTGDHATASVGENDFSCPSLGDTDYNKEIASWNCY